MGYHDLMIPNVLDSLPEMEALRHRIHAHPELSFEEFHTSDLVAERLAAWGYEVHRGLGGTGVVGTLRRGAGQRSIGLRAEMDALPIHEKTGLPYASRIEGKMHACGHDGHTATLLAAAKHLASHGRFDGALHLIFQPAEEEVGGAKAMLDAGLFDKFPCDAIFALHNLPGLPVGRFGFCPGVFLGSTDGVVIKIQGRGGHGAAPHQTVDAVTVAAYVVVALQSIVSRNVDPRQMAVVSVGAIQGGSAPNVIADSVELRLTVRAYSPEVRVQLRDRITEIATQQARALGATAEIDYRWLCPALLNDPAMTDFARQAVVDWLGEDAVGPDIDPMTGSEDFAFMLEQCAGCYLVIGNGDGDGGCMVHNPGYDFNDAILPMGASYWVKLVERFLKGE